MNEAFIFDALRTPRGEGKPNGALYEIKPINLLSTTLKAIQQRMQFESKEIDDVIIGCVTPIGDQGGNIAKAAVMYAGWDKSVPAFQINRYCASGLEAVNLAAMKIRSGWEHLVIAGGIESMSRVPMESDGGALLFDPNVSNAISYVPQGVSADLLATLNNFTRETLDAYAVQSQQRAHHAITNGYFDSSLIPIYDDNGLLVLDKDQHPRPDTNIETLGKLPAPFETMGSYGFDSMALNKYPSIEKIQHLHTAGNSSGIVDGAALVLIGSEEKGKALGLKPRAKIISVGTVGSEPTIMLEGPVAATTKALKLAGMTSKNIDLWEMNEAFAAPVLKFQQEMDIAEDILNVNGGAIAMGHPLGATGAMLIGTLLDELERRDLSIGLVTLCVGGGMAVTTIIERV